MDAGLLCAEPHAGVAGDEGDVHGVRANVQETADDFVVGSAAADVGATRIGKDLDAAAETAVGVVERLRLVGWLIAEDGDELFEGFAGAGLGAVSVADVFDSVDFVDDDDRDHEPRCGHDRLSPRRRIPVDLVEPLRGMT